VKAMVGGEAISVVLVASSEQRRAAVVATS
jgi:hypothetical protein